MTWKEIKIATLQKMFSFTGNTIGTDQSTIDYVNAMPHACNEALQLLSSAGKFIEKFINIVFIPTDNILDDLEAYRIRKIVSGSEIITVPGAKSYCFEFYGNATLEIYVAGVLFSTTTLSSNSSFSEYKGLITNTDDDVEFRFLCTYPGAIKNFGAYATTFETVQKIPSCASKVRFDMKTLAPDFRMISTQDIFYEGSGEIGLDYIKTSDFYQEGMETVVLNRNKPGNYKVYYYAYPEQITTSTSDTYVLPVDPEVAVLIPMYIASQLYKDDDIGKSSIYRNEFEIAFERLVNTNNGTRFEKIVSESGWV